MLIRDAELWGVGRADLRITGGRIAAISVLAPLPGESVIEARGGALLPGLHDHHIHLAAYAVARASLPCGPPAVTSEADLAAALARPGEGWLRGIGYHESVAGLPDARTIDRWQAERPVRIQHRSGRMWLLNSRALELLLTLHAPPPGLERIDGRWTGRLFDEDGWLRRVLGGTPPTLDAVGRELARHGVTGITDMSPGNDGASLRYFAAERAAARLPQHLVAAGTLALGDTPPPPGIAVGPAKLHLHENALPDFDQCVAFLRAAHDQGRAIASHCTTETELVFTLAALAQAGARPGDRIEHAGITPDALLEQMIELRLQVVSQPHFIAERGDQYLRDVEPRERPLLYRLGAFARAGLVLAAGSDAPYGVADPWAAMRAAVSRETQSRAVIGQDEALTPEAALALYLADPLDLSRQRSMAVGAPADLCLLDRPWAQARHRLLADDVAMTWIAGSVIHDRVDQAPA
ncbi:amidohydrolase family protein [Sphingobium yanoikuyae]|uniref:amidohydrolase family protein n=1 Tax=Sphingobium yanoikuyae TaxID=13690 RepID=UPI0026E9E10B|nr:amidohydrolase family protein [Sphingobium yanoikuyae]